MLKHLRTLVNYKVEYVTENDVYMNNEGLDNYIEFLLSNKLKIQINREMFDMQNEAHNFI